MRDYFQLNLKSQIKPLYESGSKNDMLNLSTFKFCLNYLKNKY